MQVEVALANHPYQITIEANSLTRVGSWLATVFEKRQKIAVITDETVQSFYGKELLEAIETQGFTVTMYAIPPGETSKSLAMATTLYDWLAGEDFTRTDGLIAFGGGVVGDLTGFVASTYMRGIPFVQIPTTLLAQVDSSVGGKTAVNTKSAKNLVGTFAQPAAVLIDPNTLNTLPNRQLYSGIAEIVKTAAIMDRELWELLWSLTDTTALVKQATEIIATCCRCKAKIVVEDEFDQGHRLILNFGHTIGHAFETIFGYGNLTHGEAVALGMVQISKGAALDGQVSFEMVNDLQMMLKKFHLPIKKEDWQVEDVMQIISHDKKAKGKTIRIVLVPEPGQAVIKTLQLAELAELITSSVAQWKE